jgi:hypothetical protein
VLLFAFNTDAVDYVAIAEQAARLVHHTLNLPVTLVTDHSAVTAHIDQTIIIENTLTNFRTGYAGGTAWRNGNRYQAYELSPYDETILIDSDYLMLDTSLLKMLDTTDDYRLIVDNRLPGEFITASMGPLSLDYIWATAITFKRTLKTELMFNLVGRIQRNYDYYRKLYQIKQPNFRNDYAFAIANHIVNGYTSDATQAMPVTMLTFDALIKGIDVNERTLVVREQERAHVISRQNIHIMDKHYLLSDNFNKFVDQICQD